MDVMRNIFEATAPIPSCPVVARTLKKTHPPMYDVFGPFPDETFLTIIDRLLYWLGARRVQEYFNLPRPLLEPETPHSYTTVESIAACPQRHKSLRDCSTVISEPTSPTPSVSIKRKCCCPKCRSCANTSTTCTTPATGTPRSLRFVPSSLTASISNNSIPRHKSLLKRSFSLCSLACRRLREKLSCNPPVIDTQKWLWSQMDNLEDGTVIYNLYPNVVRGSSLSCQQVHPKFILVVMANGVIIPFETVPAH